MKKYVVEFTGAENIHMADINDAWDRKIVEADSIVESADFVKDMLEVEGIDTEGFLFRVCDKEIVELTGIWDWIYVNWEV